MNAVKGTKEIDMLHGGLFRKLLIFALPLAASSILQQLFNSVDVAVVGNFALSQEQAAVGCNGPVINLMINLFVGVSVGANVVIANYIGQQKKERVKAAVHSSMVVALSSGIALILVGVLIARPLLEWMNTPSDVLEYAVAYLRIYFLGMPFIMVYNFGAAILRSVGDTRRPLYCLVISGLANVGFNLFFVLVFHLGAVGVAIATVISNLISAVMVWYILAHEAEPIRLSFRDLRISKEELRHMLHIGVPAGLQGMVFSLANVCIQSALNGLGSDVVAGSAVALNYEYFTYFMISAFAQAAITFTSQNFGAKQYDRCKRIFRLCMIAATLITGLMTLIFLLGSEFFASLFTPKQAVLEYAQIRMFYILTLYFIIPTYEIGGAVLRGIGYSMTPAVITIFGTCVLRIVWIYTVFYWFRSFEVLMMVYPVSWMITGVGVLTAYFVIGRKALGAGPA